MNHLITIGVSHYCERARWALQRAGLPFEETAYAPLIHLRGTRLKGYGQQVPILETRDGVIEGSDKIQAFADPAAAGLDLDIARSIEGPLGGATRRWTYGYLMQKPASFRHAMGLCSSSSLGAKGARLGAPVIAAAIRKLLKIDAAGVERSRAKIDQVFEAVGSILKEQPFLSGQEFGALDLAFASLGAPAVFPSDYGAGFLPPESVHLELLPDAAKDQVRRWRETRAGQHILTSYATHRHSG